MIRTIAIRGLRLLADPQLPLKPVRSPSWSTYYFELISSLLPVKLSLFPSSSSFVFTASSPLSLLVSPLSPFLPLLALIPSPPALLPLSIKLQLQYVLKQNLRIVLEIKTQCVPWLLLEALAKDHHSCSSLSSWPQLSPGQEENTVTEGRKNPLLAEFRPESVTFCMQEPLCFDHYLLLNFLRHPVAFSYTLSHL